MAGTPVLVHCPTSWGNATRCLGCHKCTSNVSEQQQTTFPDATTCHQYKLHTTLCSRITKQNLELTEHRHHLVHQLINIALYAPYWRYTANTLHSLYAPYWGYIANTLHSILNKTTGIYTSFKSAHIWNMHTLQLQNNIWKHTFITNFISLVIE